MRLLRLDWSSSLYKNYHSFVNKSTYSSLTWMQRLVWRWINVHLILVVLHRHDDLHLVLNAVDGAFFFPSPPSSPQQQQPFMSNNNNNNKFSSLQPINTEVDLWIRKSKESDLPLVAEFLANAIVVEPSSNQQQQQQQQQKQFLWNTNWKVYIDRLWAKKDIEALLQGRYNAMKEGYQALKSIRADWVGATTMTTDEKSTNGLPAVNGNSMISSRKWDSSSSSSVDVTNKEILNLLWYNSDRLRTLIAKASEETGEDNVWKQHNFALPPPNPSWLYHLQITAQDRHTGSIVGFCEIAMLGIPSEQQEPSMKLDYNTTNNNNSSTQLTTMNQPKIIRYSNFGARTTNDERIYTPGIANLATNPEWRRRGIATRLLKTAERYVQQYWNNKLGRQGSQLCLYVQQANQQALELYRRNGYEIVMSCPGDDRTGPLYYMIQTTTPATAATTSTITSTLTNHSALTIYNETTTTGGGGGKQPVDSVNGNYPSVEQRKPYIQQN